MFISPYVIRVKHETSLTYRIAASRTVRWSRRINSVAKQQISTVSEARTEHSLHSIVVYFVFFFFILLFLCSQSVCETTNFTSNIAVHGIRSFLRGHMPLTQSKHQFLVLKQRDFDKDYLSRTKLLTVIVPCIILDVTTLSLKPHLRKISYTLLRFLMRVYFLYILSDMFAPTMYHCVTLCYLPQEANKHTCDLRPTVLSKAWPKTAAVREQLKTY